MTRPATVVLGDDASGIRVTYVRARRVLCLRGWHRSGYETPSVEIPLVELAERLGFADDGLHGPQRYLVFGGTSGTRRGGSGDLVRAFDSEEPARQAFVGLRRSTGLNSGWGELVVLDNWGRPRRLGWFGFDQDRPEREEISEAQAAQAPERNGRRRPWRDLAREPRASRASGG